MKTILYLYLLGPKGLSTINDTTAESLEVYC